MNIRDLVTRDFELSRDSAQTMEVEYLSCPPAVSVTIKTATIGDHTSVTKYYQPPSEEYQAFIEWYPETLSECLCAKVTTEIPKDV